MANFNSVKPQLLLQHPYITFFATRNISNLRYADNTTLMAEGKEELKSLLMNVKEESKNVGLKLKCQSPAPAARESA